jgi:hypothetical protein
MSAVAKGLHPQVGAGLTGAGSVMGLSDKERNKLHLGYFDHARGIGRSAAEDHVRRSLLPLAAEVQGRSDRLARPPLSVVETSSELVGRGLEQLIPVREMRPSKDGYCIHVPWQDVQAG